MSNDNVNLQAKHAWIVILSANLFFFFEFIQMTMTNSVSEEFIRALNLQATDFGFFASAYHMANVVFLLAVGIILDRFSTRRLILLGMAVSIIAVIGLSWVNNFLAAYFTRFLMGAASAFCLLSVARLASRWFPANRLGFVIGVVVTIAMIGGVIAQSPFAWLVEQVGLRKGLWIDAGFGILFLILIYRFVRNFPPSYRAKHSENLKILAQTGLLASTVKALRNKQNWLSGIYISLMNLSVFLLGASFGVLYLEQVHHFSAYHASLATSMIFIGTIVGSPIVGMWSDRIGRRRQPMIIAGLMALIIVSLLIYVPHLTLGLTLLLIFLLGFFTSAQIIGYPFIAESNPTLLTSFATSIAAVLIMGAGALFQPLFGWMLTWDWSGKVINDIPIYSAHNFQWALSMLPITIIIAIIAAGLMKETYCTAQYK